MDTVRDLFIGGIWSEDYEYLSDGGPKCFNELTPQFRFTLGGISAVSTIIYMYLCWPSLKNSKELDLNRV
jgi:hypothetical protein